MNTTSTSTLNDLIQICKDGQDGFREASENVKHPELKTLFSQYSLQRSNFAGELQQLVIGLGEEPETTSSIASAIHRGWIDLKAAFTKGSDHAVLVECERGEDHAVSAYREAVTEELPAHIRDTISAQLTAVQATHDDVRRLRDSCAE